MTLEHGAIILTVAVLTYLTRIAGFQIGDRELPPALTRALEAVPIAAFVALVVPGVDLGGSEMLPRLAGVVASGSVLLGTGRLMPGLLAGMGVYAGLVIFL